MHNPTNTVISFVLLIAVVGAAFSYVSANPVEIVEPWLGIKGQIITEPMAAQLGLVQNEGFLITCVEPNSPAGNSGLKVDDIITKADDTKVIVLDDMREVLEQKQIGDSIRFEIVRGADHPRIGPLILVDKPDTIMCPP